MSRQHPLSQDIALKLGLAARAIPGNPLQSLVAFLVGLLGLPLTEAKLNSISLLQLRAADSPEIAGAPRVALRDALALLRGMTPIQVEESVRPEPDSYSDGDMPKSIRVAVASASGENLDSGFSACHAFLIYQVSANELRLIEHRTPVLEGKRSVREKAKTELIRDCDIVYVTQMSNSAAASLIRTGIHPIQLPEGGDARGLLARLQAILVANPPPWLLRAMDNLRERESAAVQHEDVH